MTTQEITPIAQNLDDSRRQSPSSPRTSHIAALDGLRGIAVLLVMTMHLSTPFYFQGTIFSKVLYKLTHYGWCGVDLFFVLSGFLITGILLRSKEGKGYFRNFYIRRTLRIFPLYYAVLFVYFVLIPSFRQYSSSDVIAVEHQRALWLYYTNIETSLYGWVQNGSFINMSHFWSLAVEEQFYLVWPLVVFLVSRRILGVICVACVAIALGLRIWLVYLCHRENASLAAYVLTPCRMDALACGALVAVLINGSKDARSLVPAAKIGLGIGVLFVLTVLLKYKFLSIGIRIIEAVGFSVIAIGFASLMVLVLTMRPNTLLVRICTNRFLRNTGSIAYGLYVFHYLLHPWYRQILVCMTARFALPVAIGIYFIIAFGLSYIISLLSWHVFEKYFIRLKDILAPYGAPGADRVPGI